MVDLPTGTVTFLFTDIEGSTRLLQELGEGYARVRDEHAAIIRRALEAEGGRELSTAGDSFFAVFRTPGQAVRAAVATQQDLHDHRWQAGAAPRVRMGVHTGEGVRGGEDYVGIDVNRAARIADAAHGGQVILSGATRALVERDLPDGASLRDLGEHRLKDLAHPEHLHDLVIEGLPVDFPPPRSLDARPNNLPVQLTSFVGREDEVAEVGRLLQGTRLLTLTGPGGTGKTRLALEVAAETLLQYADGATFVDLSSVTDPALVPASLAAALDVQEVPGRPIIDAVEDHLRDRQLLLVVDNLEQVVEAAPVLEDLLTAAPRLTVLATSRVVLALRGEQEYPVPPLRPAEPERLPDLAALRRVEAVRLFTERASAASPRFRLTEANAPAVAEITARLDGLPLAIELAAARSKVLTPEQMLPHLERRLAVLTSGPRTLPERQRTLRGAIAWSHDLLEDAERVLFARLSVFAGGWTLDAAAAVADPAGLGLDPLDGLASLVDRSLIRRIDPNGEPRFAMLETIREFALEKMEARGEAADLHRGHAEHFLGLAVAAEPHLTGTDQSEWLDRCEIEHANIRVALRWAIEAGEAERAQEAAGALWRFWQQRGHLAEARRWFHEILALPSGQSPSPARAKALTGAGGIAWWQMDRGVSRSCYEEALAIERGVGDPARIAEALYNQAFVVAVQEDVGSAAALLDESLDLFRRAGDEAGVARVLAVLVIRDAEAGNWEAVIAGLEEAAVILRRLGDRYQLANALVWLAVAYARSARSEDAHAAALESLDLFREAENPTGIALALLCLSFLATWEGRHQDAIRLAAASEVLDERAGATRTTGFAGLLEGDPAEEARGHLAEDAARRAWEEGRSMSVDQVLALARPEAGAETGDPTIIDGSGRTKR
jgi:predicted ATPase/class 3 adenylate cyclase